MNPSRETFVKTMTALAVTFDRELTTELTQAYWMALNDLDMDTIGRAAVELMRTARFFPRPAEIRELIDQDIAHEAEIAWTEVVRLAKNSQRATHPDPKAERIIQSLGGWSKLGAMSDREFHAFARKDFLESYRGTVRAETRRSISRGRRMELQDPDDSRDTNETETGGPIEKAGR